MIKTIDHTINIDLQKKININQTINIKKNDTNSHKFVINIFNNGLSYNLSDATARIYFKKYDGEKVFSDCVLDPIVTNKLSVLLTTQTLSCVGKTECEITIYGTTGEILTSVNFDFNVIDVLRDDVAIESTSEFTALTNALAIVGTISNKADKSYVDAQLLINSNKIAVLNGVGVVKEKANKDYVDSSLADIATNPDSFQGTDFQKLQQAIDYAIPLKKGIRLDRMYDITGQGTLMLSAKFGMARGYSRISSSNNGGIIKNDDGFIFSSEFENTTDFNFSHLRFECAHGALVRVYDCSKLIGITSEVNTYIGANTIFYADDTRYLQTIRMRGDFVQDMYGYVCDCVGAFNIHLDFDMEIGYAGVINQRDSASTFNYLAGVTVTCLAEAQKNASKPVFKLRDCRGVSIENCHFEVNDGGDIVLDPTGSFRQLTIKNNHFYSPTKHPVTWGGTLTSCYSEGNINLGEKGMHDTTNIVSGSVISNSDYTPVAYPNTDPASRIKYQENFQSAKNFNVVTQTQQVATDGYTSTKWGEITRVTSTSALNLVYTAGETKQVAFVFEVPIYSDDVVSIWNYDKTGKKITINHWYTSVDRLTLYAVITNNEAVSVTVFKMRATVLKAIGSIQG